MSLDGEWAVTCLGWAAIFNPLGDVKVISGGEGYNRAVGISGAWFYVCHEPAPYDRFGEKKYTLDYNHIKNHEYLRDIIDIIEIQPDDTAKGKLYKGGKFKFDFTLTRISG